VSIRANLNFQSKKKNYMPVPPPINATSENSLAACAINQRKYCNDNCHAHLYGNLEIGPLIASLSPGERVCICFDALPLSYSLIRNVSSPSRSGGEMGV
jgi:hypothetical protein